AGMPDSWPPDFPLLQASSDPRSCFHKPSIAIDQGPFPPLTPTPPGLWLPPISARREFLRSICRLFLLTVWRTCEFSRRTREPRLPRPGRGQRKSPLAGRLFELGRGREGYEKQRIAEEIELQTRHLYHLAL